MSPLPTPSRSRVPRPLHLFVLLLAMVGPVRATAQNPAVSPGLATGDGPLLVLAAASLAEVLPAVARAWEESGGIPVRFSFAATSRLAPQAVQGAAADVFVSADRRWMEWLEQAEALAPGTGRLLAANELVAVVPRGSEAPSGPGELAELGRVALAGENVPAGRYARSALEARGVWDRVSSRVVRGGSVRGALEWVARGEVEAAVVYRTDALSEPAVEVAFSFAPGDHPPVVYPAAVLAFSDRPEAARAFLDFAAGSEGAALFRQAGFRVPMDGGTAAGDTAGRGVGRTATGSVAGAGPAALSTPAAVPLDPWTAVRLSLVVALLATLVGLVPAVLLGWVLARRDFPGKVLLSTVVLAPLVLPPVVTGFLLLSLLGSQGPVGRLLSDLGLPVPFTLVGAAAAALVVGLPLYVLSVRGAFEAVDPHYEEVSRSLGVPPRRTFFRVSLPLALPGIAAGAVLAFARALGEFGATVVLAGNVEGQTRTIALAVYTLLESPGGAATTWVLVGASVALSLLALVGYEALSRRQRRRLEHHGGR